jgi:hypothetical protein
MPFFANFSATSANAPGLLLSSNCSSVPSVYDIPALSKAVLALTNERSTRPAADHYSRWPGRRVIVHFRRLSATLEWRYLRRSRRRDCNGRGSSLHDKFRNCLVVCSYRDQPVKIARSGELNTNTPQTPGMVRPPPLVTRVPGPLSCGRAPQSFSRTSEPAPIITGKGRRCCTSSAGARACAGAIAWSSVVRPTPAISSTLRLRTASGN